MSKKGLDYIIEYKAFEQGTYEIDYQLDKNFFELFPESEFKDGDVSVKVIMQVSIAGLSFDFDISGSVKTECDRCLEIFDQEIEGFYNLTVKFSDTQTDSGDDDIIFLPTEETEIDLKHHIYEYVVLSVPPRRVHPEDEDGNLTCNPEMVKALEEFQPTEQEEETEPQTDPRWDKLKGLL
ncbi:MAG: DUF177 domain-containing protein [Bacteroidales bacterium]|jgi:uncharacterized metal-binding protein YceD (DUF177 family)|nr:DUF177 domain-containing protein [Bacteroidales bacterium]MCR4560389.1 DUF177 domain-containing protein [Bacteroidales bacterium]